MSKVEEVNSNKNAQKIILFFYYVIQTVKKKVIYNFELIKYVGRRGFFLFKVLKKAMLRKAIPN